MLLWMRLVAFGMNLILSQLKRMPTHMCHLNIHITMYMKVNLDTYMK